MTLTELYTAFEFHLTLKHRSGLPVAIRLYCSSVTSPLEDLTQTPQKPTP